ncbi:MAG: hypothetical protein AAGC57_13095 [Pseudomonadota bacterium]
MSAKMKFEKDVAKALFKKFDGAEREIPYAFGLGKTPDDSRLAIHKSLKPKALANGLQKEGTFKKIGYGSIKVADGRAVFTPIKPVGHLVKLLRADMRKIGYAVELAEGADGAGEPLTPEQRKEWISRMEGLEREIDKVLEQLEAA